MSITFYSGQSPAKDRVLFELARFFPMLFTEIVKKILPSKVHAVGGLPEPLPKTAPQMPLNSYKEYVLITARPHVREKTMLARFGDRIKQVVILDSAGRDYFSEHGIPVRRIFGDWIEAWLLIYQLWQPGRLIIICGISDFWFMPLKFHPLAHSIAFDSYDPLGDYARDARTRAMTKLNYRNGKNYFLRDGRFRHALVASGNVAAQRLYLPDIPNLPTVSRADLKARFGARNKITFVCAGWTSGDGDDSILRSLTLIKKIWPNSEIHFCLTQFMQPENSQFSPLFRFVEQNPGCFLHRDLQGKAYTDVLDRAHVGVNLHDINVFGEEYSNYDRMMIRRCASARVLDFAVRGCILMTTREHIYGRIQFRRFSPHGKVFYLQPESRSEQLVDMMIGIADTD